MQTLSVEKKSFRNFLLWYCSWNFLLDIGSLALVIWFASFYENSLRIIENHLLIFTLFALSFIRTSYYFILLTIKGVRKKWNSFSCCWQDFSSRLFSWFVFCRLFIMCLQCRRFQLVLCVDMELTTHCSLNIVCLTLCVHVFRKILLSEKFSMLN